MKTVIKTQTYNAPPEKVFQLLDDLSVTGMHMTQSSMAMMGSKLNLEFLTENKTGLGTKFRWTGKMLWMKMDFTVVVTKWIKGKEKVWETVGESKMIIYSWYRMNLILTSTGELTVATLSITYEKPNEWYFNILSFFFAKPYCNWCLNNMLRDCKKLLEK